MKTLLKLQSLIFVSLLLSTYNVNATNLTCYQCVRNDDVQCGPEDLLPCSATHDRCVTHILKNPVDGFTIKRECGLGPCGFDDAMMNRGLGLDICDRSKKNFFCIFCCQENGCNKSSSSLTIPSLLLLLAITFVVVLNIFDRFQPPYVAQDD